MPYTFFRFIERTKINAMTNMYHINAYALEGIKEGEGYKATRLTAYPPITQRKDAPPRLCAG